MKLRLLSAAVMALGLAACSTTSHGYHGDGSSAYRAPGNCYDCGIVQSIQSYTGERRSTGAGAVAGAVIGGVLGNQVGKGDGKTAATVAGAVVGGLAGNAIEKNADHTWYDISVRMNDGRQVVVTQDDLKGVREGAPVIIRDGRAQLQ